MIDAARIPIFASFSNRGSSSNGKTRNEDGDGEADARDRTDSDDAPPRSARREGADSQRVAIHDRADDTDEFADDQAE